MKKLLIILLMLIASTASAADWYVDNTASGTNAGTSWTNAWESIADIVWGSVGAGDTIYISGGSTSKTYYEPLDVSNSNVTIQVGQTAGHNGQAIIHGSQAEDNGLDFSGLSNVTVSGQVGAGTDCNLRFTQWDQDGIDIRSITNVELAYLEVDNNGDENEEDGIYISNVDGGGNSVHHCDIHDNWDEGIHLTGGTADNSSAYKEDMEIHHNEIYNIGGDGIIIGQGADGTSIYNNEIHTQSPNDAQHSPGYTDGIQSLAMQYMEFYNNIFYDLNISSPDTANAAIFVESHVVHDINNIRVYNNLIYDNNPDQNYWRGIYFKATSSASITVTNVLIANNTVVDLPFIGIRISFNDGIGTADISNFVVENNLVYNCARVAGSGDRKQATLEGTGNWTVGSHGDGADITYDYNVFEIYGAGTMEFEYKGTDYSYSDFTSAARCDCNDNGSGTVPPFFEDWTEENSVDLQLDNRDVAALNLGVTQTAFATDLNAIARPQGASWDIGAYEYDEGSGPPLPPPTITGVSIGASIN